MLCNKKSPQMRNPRAEATKEEPRFATTRESNNATKTQCSQKIFQKKFFFSLVGGEVGAWSLWGRIMAPPKWLCPSPGTCECSLIWLKGFFSGVIKLRIFRWGIILDYLDGLNVITKVLMRERGRVSSTHDYRNKSSEWHVEGAMH